MNGSIQLLRLGAVTALLILSVACSRDPHDTRLPMDLKDIAKVQPQLDKLPNDERQLLLDYLTRSKGDVLPAQFADPDAPLTARTFGEAIKLQREFKAKQAVEITRMEELHASREAAMEPLRKVLQVGLIKREIQTYYQVTGRHPAAGQAFNDKPVLVVTFLLSNTGGETITGVSGSATLRSVSDPKSLLGLFSCFITYDLPIVPGDSIPIRCFNPNLSANPANEEFVSMPEYSLLLTWEPKSVALAGGEVLKSMQ